MRSKRLFVGVALLASGALLMVFQNCSPVNFTSAESLASAKQSGNGEVDPAITAPDQGGIQDETLAPIPTQVSVVPTPAPTAAPTPEPEVICDPFSAGSKCEAGKGLKGNVYSFNGDEPGLSSKKVNDYIAEGFRSNKLVVFSKFDIATRSWDLGFPAGEGDFLATENGSRLVEWFALDLKGMIRLGSQYATGDYQFALMSDDGATLEIEGQMVVDNDGVHSPKWSCSPANVHLKQGDLYDVKLKYFQGPRNQIALRLLWRPSSESHKPCGDNGGFTPVPADILYN